MDNPTIPPEALEGLMKKVFVEKAHPTGLFWDALLKSHLYVPLKGKVEDFSKPVDEETNEFPVLLGLDPDNQPVLWMFTSPQILAEYTQKELPYIEMLAPKLFEKLSESSYEIVLIGPYGLTLSLHPELLEKLAQGQVPDTREEVTENIPKDAEVYVGKPKEETDLLEERLIRLFEENEFVTQASFIQVADDTGSRLLLGLLLKKDNRDTLKDITYKIAKAIEGALDKGQRLDVTLMSGSLKEAFQKYGRHFYEKT